ncbi:DUF2089 family protein [Staphylococcus gallinarum]|uniref:DUF2089 family protein n=1 Tax=Staphylococcus gallinarum TaxID=1293 RepID=UPI0039EEB6B4
MVNNLENEGLECIKNFVLYSSSLKGLASFYEVSYSTVRNRLNIVIKKSRQLKKMMKIQLLTLFGS